MADISSFLLAIKNAIYGEEVRDSIYNAINAMNNENLTIASRVTNTVQSTLDNFKVYEHVSELPEVGDSQLLYAVSDIVTTESDSNNSNYNDWSELQNERYIQVPVNEVSYTNVNASAVKPVMARYYLINQFVTLHLKNGSSTSVTSGDIVLKEKSLAVTVGGPWSSQYIQKSFDNICFDFVEIASGDIQNIQSGDLTFTCLEFIYDAYDRLWKFNDEKTIEYTYLKYDSADKVLRFTAEMGLDDILFCHNFKGWISQYTPIPPVDIYHSGYRYSAIKLTLGKLGEMEYDSEGYETNAHSTDMIISIQRINGGFYWDGTSTIDYVEGEPKIWQVPYSIGSTATMYIWSDAIKSYIALRGEIDTSEVLPTGYSKTLESNGWESVSGGYSYSVSGINIVQNQAYTISVSPDTDSKTEYINNNVYCKEILFTLDGPVLIFMADTEPSSNLDVGIVIQKINGSTVINNE